MKYQVYRNLLTRERTISKELMWFPWVPTLIEPPPRLEPYHRQAIETLTGERIPAEKPPAALSSGGWSTPAALYHPVYTGAVYARPDPTQSFRDSSDDDDSAGAISVAVDLIADALGSAADTASDAFSGGGGDFGGGGSSGDW